MPPIKDARIAINGWFNTSTYGGICLNVKKLVSSPVRFFEVDIKVESLLNFVISANHHFNITGRIILISNFGIVDGHDLFLKSPRDHKKSVLLYEYKDAYPYFYDEGDTDVRLKKIFTLNLDKFEPIICDFTGFKKKKS